MHVQIHQSPPIILRFIRQHIKDENNQPEKVKVLNLKNCKVHQVACLQLLPNLKVVDLRNNNLLQIAGFQLCHNITELHLCQNFITKIKRIQHLKKLKLIDLRGNHIRDLNSSISNIPSSVVELKIRCNHITNFQQIWKINNSFQTIWLDQNLFVKGTKNHFKFMFGKKGWNVTDFWV